MKTSKAQLQASKKYLEGKDRINLVLGNKQKWMIDETIKQYGYYESVPDFIREAIDYYVRLHVVLGDIPSRNVIDNFGRIHELIKKNYES